MSEVEDTEDDGRKKRPKLESSLPEERRPKRRVAILIGYCGTGYGGMQLNPSVETIESVLFQSLVQVGAISRENANDPGKSSWMRAARTDKGVHAACNLVTVKLLEPMGEDSSNWDMWVERLNEVLASKKIRVWSIQRIMASFHARKDCRSRIYEYLCPTHVFIPPSPTSFMGKMLAQKGVEVHPFWTLSSESAMEIDDTSNAAGQIKNKLFQTETLRKRSWRISPVELDRVREIAQAYEGSHNFHNHTSGKDFREQTAHRTIHKITVSDPFVKSGGQEWVSIKIHGQSFILHQIRKMIGLLILVVRSNSPKQLIAETFKQEKIHVPKAPGLGLLLQELFFDAYDQKLLRVEKEHARSVHPENTMPADDRQSIRIRDRDKVDRFKEEFIYTNIFEDDIREDQ